MPRKPQQPLTDEEKFKLQEAQEHELQTLQRQYSLLEKDRRLFFCGIKLGRLSRILSIYKREHNNIEADLEVASADAKKREDRKDSEHLSKLLEDHDYYDDEVLKQRKYIQEIEGQIKRVERNVVVLRSKQITDRQHEDRVWAAIKTVEALMNKLDVQNKKFGTICAKNRDMKQAIKRMLWERDVFMKIWNKWINKLVLGKKFMLDLIEQATIAYDQREEWCSKLQALRIKAHYDFGMHTQEMRELKRKQDNQKKLEDFFNIKGQKRVMKDLEAKEREARMRNIQNLKSRLKEYNTYMSDIMEFTKETEMEVIAKKHFRREAENFSLFLRVNNLMEELEFLNLDLFKIQNEITDERELQAKRVNQQHSTIARLESEVEIATKELHDTEEELHSVEDYIQAMLEGIDKLFKICRCEQDPILRLLGDNRNISVYTVFMYVEMIERMVQMAMVEVYSDEKALYDRKKIVAAQRIVWDDNTKGELGPLDKFAPSSPCPLCVSHEMVSDVIDSVQRVLNRDQVKQEVAEHLKTTEFVQHVHNVSQCFLPESRDIIQRRYQ